MYNGSLEAGEPPVIPEASRKSLSEICNELRAPEGLTFQDLLEARH